MPLGNRKNKIVKICCYTFITLLIVIAACKKEKECDKTDPNSECYVPPVVNNPTEPTKNCDVEQNAYETAQATATTDSVAVEDFKATVPDIFLSLVNTNMLLDGMSEEEAWNESIKTVINSPNAPQILKEWVLAYKNFLDSFNKSVEEREEALAALLACQQRLVKQ